MANRSADFNYKVALASGLKSLQGGRLRQAEEQFRYLVQHFPTADGGYRGLAKVLVEQEDRPAALRVLLDGGAALAKSDQRAAAIGLYREATTLDPHDLTAHRRLAAALALAGDQDQAAHEYVRYISAALSAGDAARAKLEAAYALERLPGNSEIAEAARTAGADAPAATAAPQTASFQAAAEISNDDRAALMRSAFGTPAETPAPSAWEAPAASSSAWETAAPGAQWDTPAPRMPVEPAEPIAADADPLAVEASAAQYLAAGDPRGGQHALEAARRHIADGRIDAASDLLLQLIASGIAPHDAQRLLLEVTKTLGRRDVAKAKVQLLVEALRLDGRTDLAAEVEQLAQAF